MIAIFITLKSKSRKRQKQCTVTLYYGGVNYLLQTYATDDVVAESEADKMRFTQPLNNSPIECPETLENKTLRCDRVHEDMYSKAFFNEELLNPSTVVCTYTKAPERT